VDSNVYRHTGLSTVECTVLRITINNIYQNLKLGKQRNVHPTSNEYVSQMLKQGGIVNVFTKLHKQFRKCYMNIPYNWQKLCVLLPFKPC